MVSAVVVRYSDPYTMPPESPHRVVPVRVCRDSWWTDENPRGLAARLLKEGTLRSSVASRSSSLSVSASDLLVCTGCGSGTGCWDTGRGKGRLCLGSPAMEAKQESETVFAGVNMEQGSPWQQQIVNRLGAGVSCACVVLRMCPVCC